MCQNVAIFKACGRYNREISILKASTPNPENISIEKKKNSISNFSDHCGIQIELSAKSQLQNGARNLEIIRAKLELINQLEISKFYDLILKYEGSSKIGNNRKFCSLGSQIF
jgi:hypothetical protein